jgi:hypothetical protein
MKPLDTWGKRDDRLWLIRGGTWDDKPCLICGWVRNDRLSGERHA